MKAGGTRSGTPQCPADREPISRKRIFSDVACHRKILNARVKCPNEECSWIGELRDVKKHGELCSYQPVPCLNEGCSEEILRKDIISHVETTCPWSVIQCAFCPDRFPKLEKKAHCEVCPRYPVECSNKCGVKDIPREEVGNHTENLCPLTVIECEYSAIGCRVKFQRRDSKAHFDAFKDTHLHLACKKLVDMSKTVQEQAQTIVSLEGKLQRFQNSPFIWKISNFTSVVTESPVKISDPFYSYRNGYKFQVELYPNGYHIDDNAGSEGQFMSIYLRILVGEYDGLLIWPFNHTVVFTLLDQNESMEKRRHLRQEAHQTPNGLVRPSEASEEACGVWEFVHHKDLFKRPYIKDDTIFIKFAFVEHKDRKFSRIFPGDYDV
ncbi:TNF receptor-associated factor 5-like isoform X3 [Stylophora pistillata]|uniref:TNF receptor-associated factor 5-like isoform X3 n=1 Tax=Stylophora pistillata TaxID=50429 RepID=UPI000C046727|nr:TNF receptor-associated factor 5-like isoform X3 [Stylophora pistillata]